MARQIRREVPAVSKFKGFLATVLSLLERRLRNVDDVWQKSKYHRFTRRAFTRFYEVVHWEEGARRRLECGIYCAPYCLLLVPKEAACVSVAFCPCLLL